MLYKLKSVARRGTFLVAAASLAASSFAPLAPPAFADALNPLTDRSLTLSSSAPGWDYLDGSGNTTYAQPNSGANGQKTGNTFSFKVSSSETIKGMTFQYCTTSAGDCLAPGNNDWTGAVGSATRNADSASTSDLKVVTDTPTEVGTSDFNTVVDTGSATGQGTITTTTSDGDVVGVGTAFDTQLAPGDSITTAGDNTYEIASITDATHLTLTTTPATAEAGVAFTYPTDFAGEVVAVPGFADPNDAGNTTGQFAAKNVAGNFVVYFNDGGTWKQSSGWSMTASENQTTGGDGTAGVEADKTSTGELNYITLTNSTGEAFTTGQQVKVVFFGTADNYIQNPGAGAFFVKINTYNSDTAQTDATLVDGGVTVANVMNQSIKIQTKVLETMKFSVGTVDPNTLTSNGTDLTSAYGKATGAVNHGTCDAIVGNLDSASTDPVNVLKLGNQAAESSLSDEATYATHSFWRLSSNSSAGATVYYSGVTLSNTVGDKIAAIGPTAAVSHKGDEQFGLALMTTGATDDYGVDYSQVATYENGDDNGLTSLDTDVTNGVPVGNASWHTPRLYPLVPDANYAYGAGDADNNSGETTPGAFDGNDTTAKFAFDETSNSVPVAMATEDSEVVDCVTGKVRYIANIASTTPAGIYTTAVNYIAAPQY